MGILDRFRSAGSNVRSRVEGGLESRKKERERKSVIRSLARSKERDEDIRYKEKLRGQKRRRGMKERINPDPPRRRSTRRSSRRERRQEPRRTERQREPQGMLGFLGLAPGTRPQSKSRASNGRTYNPVTMTWSDTRKRRKRR